MSCGVRRLLYRTVNFFADSRHARGKTDRRALFPIDG
jgi:hypothetical protein